jgi:hypothetical protein
MLDFRFFFSWIVLYGRSSPEFRRYVPCPSFLIPERWKQIDPSKFWKPSAILTHSTVQSPSWEANWFAASQEIPSISRNPNVHYRTHKPPPPVSILGQPNPVHIPTSHLLEIRPNIIHLQPYSTETEPNHDMIRMHFWQGFLLSFITNNY